MIMNLIYKLIEVIDNIVYLLNSYNNIYNLWSGLIAHISNNFLFKVTYNALRILNIKNFVAFFELNYT